MKHYTLHLENRGQERVSLCVPVNYYDLSLRKRIYAYARQVTGCHKILSVTAKGG